MSKIIAGPDPRNLGTVIHEQYGKFCMGEALIWEETLRLYVKPMPWFMPVWMWKIFVRTVLVQVKAIKAP